jgi:sulfite reductase beta subunit-like hemoprotein
VVKEDSMHTIARIIGGAALCAGALTCDVAVAASHREAPLIANDPAADNTDFYLFRSWSIPPTSCLS